MLELVRQFGGGLGTDVQNQVVVGHVGGFFHGRYRVGSKGFGSHHIGRDRDFGTPGLHGLDHGFGLGHQISFGQTFANLQARSQHEGVGDAAAHNQLVHVLRQAFEDGQLGRHLRARHDGRQWAFGVGQGFANRVDLGRQQRPGTGDRGELGDTVGRALGAVGGAKGVVHIDIAQRSHFAGQHFLVLFLALVDAAVFEQHDLTRGHGHTIDPIGHQRHITAQQLA